MNTKDKKERLDNILFSLGYFETKNQAQAVILTGKVKVNGQIITKAGTQISKDEKLNIEVESMPYVSRGGFKLEKAFKEFNLSVKDKICLDSGASTGGFTDCLLQNNAKKVYAVDVGYGQLSWKLRNHPGVIVIERTNIRNAKPDQIYKDLDISDSSLFAEFASLDLSFISVSKVLENVKRLMNPEYQEIVALIKPQFEAGRKDVPKSGVVKDKNIHVNVIKKILDFSCTLSLFPVDLTYSPIKGPAGNIEYLVFLSSAPNKSESQVLDESYNNNDNQSYLSENKIITVVNQAYEQL